MFWLPFPAFTYNFCWNNVCDCARIISCVLKRIQYGRRIACVYRKEINDILLAVFIINGLKWLAISCYVMLWLHCQLIYKQHKKSPYIQVSKLTRRNDGQKCKTQKLCASTVISLLTILNNVYSSQYVRYKTARVL